LVGKPIRNSVIDVATLDLVDNASGDSSTKQRLSMGTDSPSTMGRRWETAPDFWSLTMIALMLLVAAAPLLLLHGCASTDTPSSKLLRTTGSAGPPPVASPDEQAIIDSLTEKSPTGERKKLTPIEFRRLLSMAKILRAAQVKFPDPGPHKLVIGKNGEELWQGRGDTGDFGGTLTVSSFGTGPKTFNVWAATDAASQGLGRLMFEQLLEVDPWTGSYYPRLAREFIVDPNRQDYTIKLRKGLKWSDGHSLTADDVVFTLNTIIKEGYGMTSTRDTLMVKGTFPEVTKVDDLTIKFHTKEPFAPFPNSLKNVCIAPKHIFEKITSKPREEFHNFWAITTEPSSMVVSGPFKLSRNVPGQRVELARNPNFAMVDKEGRRLPYLDKFMMIIVPDQNTELLKFYGDEVNFLDIRTVRGHDAALMKQKESSGNFTMYNLGPDDSTTFITFNLARRKDPKTGKFYLNPIKQRWFNNLYFRQAVSHAIDRQRLVDNVLKGVGLPEYSFQNFGSKWFNENLIPFGQDLNLSAELLRKGGFVKRGGLLYDDQGNKVEFDLNTNAGNIARDATSVMIVNDLKKLGISVNYQPLAWNVLVDKTNTSLDWDAIIMGLTGNKIEPYDSANVWKSNGRLHVFDQRLPDKEGLIIASDARDWEKEIDNAFDSCATTFDAAERKKYIDKAQEISFRETPFIYLYVMLNITAMRNNVGNYRPTPLGITYPPKGTLHNVEEIYIKGGGQRN